MQNYRNDSLRKIAFWGVGKVCQMCLDVRPDLTPSFFIDKYCESKYFLGKKIVKPENIKNWKNLFIVIANTAVASVERELKSYGCKPIVDYISYMDYLGLEKSNIESCLRRVKSGTDGGTLKKKSTLIIAPFMQARNGTVLRNFFKKYNVIHNNTSIGLSNILPYGEEYVSNQMGFPVINLPELCKWDGRVRYLDEVDKNDFEKIDSLNIEENKWIEKLEERKVSVTKDSKKISCAIYFFIKEILNELEPRAIILWSAWSRFGYIVSEIAKRNNIPYVLAEWGWIPGTLQFDSIGIAGQSGYAKNKNFKSVLEKIEKYDYCKLKEYVMTTFKESGVERDNKKEISILEEIKCNKKPIILFIGCGDVGMGINPQSDFWKENVSNLFESSIDVANEISLICGENDYNFIFKPHPDELTILDEEINIYCNNTTIIKDLNIRELISSADVVLSIASAADYLVLLMEKPLIQLGMTGMNYVGCTYRLQEKNLLYETIKEALNKGVTFQQKHLFIKYVGFLLETYLWDDLTHPEYRYGRNIQEESIFN